MKRFAGVLLMVLMTAPTTPRAQRAADAIRETPQGALVMDYIRAFNTGDETAWLAFGRTKYSSALMAQRPESERVESYRRLRERLGTINMEDVLAGDGRRIAWSRARA